LNSIEEIFKKLSDYSVFGAGEGIRILDPLKAFFMRSQNILIPLVNGI